IEFSLNRDPLRDDVQSTGKPQQGSEFRYPNADSRGANRCQLFFDICSQTQCGALSTVVLVMPVFSAVLSVGHTLVLVILLVRVMSQWLNGVSRCRACCRSHARSRSRARPVHSRPKSRCFALTAMFGMSRSRVAISLASATDRCLPPVHPI